MRRGLQSRLRDVQSASVLERLNVLAQQLQLTMAPLAVQLCLTPHGAGRQDQSHGNEYRTAFHSSIPYLLRRLRTW